MKRGKKYLESVASFDKMTLFDPEEGVKICKPVSYTHLDVYKRQSVPCR